MKLTHEKVSELAAEYGDAFYVFDRDRFIANFGSFLSAFAAHYSETCVAYSYKTNYTPAICKLVDSLGGYAEVVSAMEFEVAMRAGIDCRRVIYNGPYKSFGSVRAALQGGATVNLDSVRDLELLRRVVQGNSFSGRVALRCNFDIGTGRISRFGMDVNGEEFAAVLDGVRALGGIELAGLHCHFQDRDLESFARRMRLLLDTAERVFEEPPEFLNVGGGYLGRLPESLHSRYAHEIPAYADYGRVLGELMNSRYPRGGPRPLLFTEPGTALVADTFRFVTRVVGRKRIRGKDYAHAAGSIFNTSPYSRVTSLPVTVLRADENGGEPGPVDVCGYTCIETDVLSRHVNLSVAIDDFLVYENVGSYSIVMKPPFIVPNVPVLMFEGDSFRVIKRAETIEDLFRTFEWT